MIIVINVIIKVIHSLQVAAVCEKLMIAHNIEELCPPSSFSSSSFPSSLPLSSSSSFPSSSYPSSSTFPLSSSSSFPSSSNHTSLPSIQSYTEENEDENKINYMNNYRKKSTTKNRTKIKIKDNEKKGNNKNNDNSEIERKEVVHRGSVDSIQHTVLGEIPRNQKPDKISVLNFEDFSLGPLGIPLKTAYENAKETLVENKNRQRQIVSVLNKLKLCIDDLQLKLKLSGGECSDSSEGKRGGEGEGKTEGGEDEGERKEGEGEREEEEEEEEKEGANNNNNKNNQNKQHKDKNKNKDKDKESDKDRESSDMNNNTINIVISDLMCAKRDYRLSTKELQLCKLQVMEIQSLKKIALSTLLQAYQNQK